MSGAVIKNEDASLPPAPPPSPALVPRPFPDRPALPTFIHPDGFASPGLGGGQEEPSPVVRFTRRELSPSPQSYPSSVSSASELTPLLDMDECFSEDEVPVVDVRQLARAHAVAGAIEFLGHLS